MAQANTTAGESGAQPRIMDRVRERASAQLSSQKNRATDGLGTVAEAVRQTTNQLRDQQHDTMAGYVEQAAEQLERLSNRLRNKEIGELVDDAQGLARRQPALFIGSAFAAGLFGARFLKSSNQDRGPIARQHFGERATAYPAASDPGRGRESMPSSRFSDYGEPEGF